MEPMFLPEIEADKKDSPYRDAIEIMKRAGPEYPQIWHLFAFAPQVTHHLAQFTQGVMREESPLSPGFRELIAAYTSYQNGCDF